LVKNVIKTEHHLAAVAMALLSTNTRPLKAERALLKEEGIVSEGILASIRAEIRNGKDPLGEAFSQLRKPAARRLLGATYTPDTIITAMIDWAKAQPVSPVRVVDPGAGSGRFIFAAARAFPSASLIAIDIDPLATLMLRATACVLGLSRRLKIRLGDFRSFTLPRMKGPTLFVGNPPYVRHHGIEPKWKKWFCDAGSALGFTASGLAGLHIHFFLRTRQIARPGDFGAYITAAEWLDVNYGAILRKMLVNGLGGTDIHLLDPGTRPFDDAFTTGAITCFHIGSHAEALAIRKVEKLEKLAPLTAGHPVAWNILENAPKWSILIRPGQTRAHGELELGELFKVHRGQVTGSNAIWIAGTEAQSLPARFLIPCITRARELIEAGEFLDQADALRRVIDLPVNRDEMTPAEWRSVETFLEWARSMNGDKGFVATHRKAWWSVGLKEPAPILCTYMARRAPAFVRNRAGVRHINIAHGLYPREPLDEAVLDAVASHLRQYVCMSSGRTYAGGLVKFEPGEVSRLHIPSLDLIAIR